jgi:hypothetical protein
MTEKPIQYTQKQRETIDLFRDVISKAAIKIFQDSKNFTNEALSVLDKVYANLNESNLTITALSMSATRNKDNLFNITKYHAFAAIAFSSILTLHAKNLRHGLASLFGISEASSTIDLGSIFSHTVNLALNVEEKEILGAISQTIVVGSDSTHQEGSGIFAPLTGGRIFEGTWFTSDKDSTGFKRNKSDKNFSKDDEYPYVGVSYLTFGLNRQDKMFEKFDENNNGYLGDRLNDGWFLISQITPMPDSFFDT